MSVPLVSVESDKAQEQRRGSGNEGAAERAEATSPGCQINQTSRGWVCKAVHGPVGRLGEGVGGSRKANSNPFWGKGGGGLMRYAHRGN